MSRRRKRDQVFLPEDLLKLVAEGDLSEEDATEIALDRERYEERIRQLAAEEMRKQA